MQGVQGCEAEVPQLGDFGLVNTGLVTLEQAEA